MLPSLGWLGAAAALVCAQTDGAQEPPFTLELPDGYQDFRRVERDADRWKATAHDGKAVFHVEHHLLTVPGAAVEAVAQDRRTRDWAPRLRGTEHQITPWSGTWAGYDAAGSDIRYTWQGEQGVVLERLLVLHDHLVRVLWEGRAATEEAARAALEGFRVPEAWLPDPPPRHDPRRGLGEHGGERPFPGALAVDVDLRDFVAEDALVVTVRWDRGDADTAWNLPPGAQRQSVEPGDGQTGAAVRYRLVVDDAHSHGNAWGLTRTAEDLAALDAGWLAVPRSVVGTDHGYLPPAWSLTARFPPHLRLASAGGVGNVYDAEAQVSTAEVAGVEAARAWPFFVAARYEPQQAAGRTWYLRKDAQARSPDAAPRALYRLVEARQEWLPAPARRGPVITFPNAGDRALPGLYVLDERLDWLGGAMDAQREGLTRRTWLARLAAQALFGAHLRGRGSGATFLEAGLAEYGAWRLLQRTWPEDAAALADWWRAREEELGALPLPLSLTPPADLFAARRTLSRGGLVWRAIEERAGRKTLDALLAARVEAGTPWTTEDLRADLERRTEESWEEFFRAHVYGLQAP